MVFFFDYAHGVERMEFLQRLLDRLDTWFTAGLVGALGVKFGGGAVAFRSSVFCFALMSDADIVDGKLKSSL
jgi:hypothetical protein